MPEVGLQLKEIHLRSFYYSLLAGAQSFGERVPIRYNQQINETDFVESLSRNLIFPRILGGSSHA